MVCCISTTNLLFSSVFITKEQAILLNSNDKNHCFTAKYLGNLLDFVAQNENKLLFGAE